MCRGLIERAIDRLRSRTFGPRGCVRRRRRPASNQVALAHMLISGEYWLSVGFLGGGGGICFRAVAPPPQQFPGIDLVVLAARLVRRAQDLLTTMKAGHFQANLNAASAGHPFSQVGSARAPAARYGRRYFFGARTITISNRSHSKRTVDSRRRRSTN